MKWFAIFRTGKHTDSEGREREWSRDDLDKIIEMNDGKETPLVIGHPETSSPAYGWATEFKRDGELLYARATQIVSEFADWVKKGFWKKPSISIRDDYTLRHIGFLGATPPSIKGLPVVEFQEKDGSMTYEFSDWKDNRIASIFQRLRDFIIEKFGLETADKIITSYDIDDVKLPEAGEVASSFAEDKQSQEKEDDMDKVQELETKLKDREKEIADFSEKDKAKDVELARLKKDLADEKAKTRKAEFQTFCEGLEKEGKLTPAMKPAVLDFMEILSGATEYEFAEGDSKVKAQPLERFKTFLNGLTKAVEFGEHATKNKAGDAGGDIETKRKAAVSDYMEKNKDASYKEAVLEVSKEHPELFEREG